MKILMLFTLLLSFNVQAGWKFGPVSTLNGSAFTFYEKEGDEHLIEGDILVDPISIRKHWKNKRKNKAGTKAVSRLLRKKRWKGGIIPYEIDPEIPNQGRITWAINYYHTYTGIKLVPRTTEKDYVYFKFNGNDSCSSHVGRKGGKQVINIPNWCPSGSVVHEILHALGFYHEQSRLDRSKWIKVKWSNIKISKWPNFFRKWLGIRYGKTFDFDSIMLYGSYSGFAKDSSKPVLTTRDGGTWSSQRRGLSAGDKEALEQYYKGEL